MFVTHQREKLLNAIVFFVKHTQRCHKLKLFKLLHFLDFEHYRQTGRPSLGLCYEAWPMGPVPHELDDEFDHPSLDLQTTVRIRRRRDAVTGRPIRYDFTPKVPWNQAYFSRRELRIMRELALYFNEFKGEDMSELSHLTGLPWRTVYKGGAGDRQVIPYDLAIKAKPLTDGDTIQDDELAYRREAMEGIVT